MKHTTAQYRKVQSHCRKVFADKMRDYGTAWRVLRLPSLTDQIFIKAQRIRSIEENGAMAVDEGIIPEFTGIINYSLMALIQLSMGADTNDTAQNPDEILEMYENRFDQALELMILKNTDYGEAWRDMRVSSYTDIILMKLLRIKQIEDNQGKTLVSEGVDANYFDIINYAVFALIKLTEPAP
ncbi:MAG TPA: DUF1599 domain-containing protein [Bacteroidales bacterium]|nr:DUF1599 domain-containing protein [Bacteroidales bacterium]HRZ47815.1 DUF1599 domain-containing protein [Bacteroidales bacterium]